MAKRINLVESIISVGFDDKDAQRGLRKLKRQLKGQDDLGKATAKRNAKNNRRQLKHEKQIRKEQKNRGKESLNAQEKLQKRADKYRQQKKRDDERTLRMAAMASRERRAEELHQSKMRQYARKDEADKQREMRVGDAYRRNVKKAERIERDAKANERRKQEAHQEKVSRSKAAERRASARERRAQARHSMSMFRMGRGNAGILGTFASVGAATYAGTQFLAAENAVNAIQTDYEVNRTYTDEQGNTQRYTPEQALQMTNQIAGKLTTLADGMGVSFTQMAEEFAAASPLANQIGMSIDQQGRWAEGMMMAQKAFGLTQEDITNTRRNLSQIFADVGQGKLEQRDLNEMRNRPAFYNWFMKRIGAKSDAEAKEMVASGQLTQAELYNALSGGFEDLRPSYTRWLETTAGGAIQKLTAEVDNLAVIFGGGARGGFIEMLNSITTVLNENRDGFKQAGEWVGELFKSVAGGVNQMNEAWKGLSPDEQEQVISTLGTVLKIIGALVAAKGLFGLLNALKSLVLMTPHGRLIAALIAITEMMGLFDGQGGRTVFEKVFGKEAADKYEYLFDTENFSFDDIGTYGSIADFREAKEAGEITLDPEVRADMETLSKQDPATLTEYQKESVEMFKEFKENEKMILENIESMNPVPMFPDLSQSTPQLQNKIGGGEVSLPSVHSNESQSSMVTANNSSQTITNDNGQTTTVYIDTMVAQDSVSDMDNLSYTSYAV
ncbi:hypothetical protein CGK32_22965 [Vibrio parahaemolyticus]|uniref:hypothetical protein n=1 Tax=Vibrio parahaemolyticus TaxID=670 RepID=UPI00111D2E79|nr:hypothetical protein [Vibrio parahaemolyticus]TOA17892.1 hypothetical protein CGK32_22965 [Vibrio parahaemolyticus]